MILVRLFRILINPKERKQECCCLSSPTAKNGESFSSLVRNEWQSWRKNLREFPSSLILLYGGVAFYEYYTREFWPQFEEAIGHYLPLSQRQNANDAFVLVSRKHDLKIRERQNGTDYVGSAVHHIGIPISLWDEFSRSLPSGHYQSATGANFLMRNGWNSPPSVPSGEPVSKNFLVDNRDTASDFIKEMLDAREILIKDHSLTISDFKTGFLASPGVL